MAILILVLKYHARTFANLCGKLDFYDLLLATYLILMLQHISTVYDMIGRHNDR